MNRTRAVSRIFELAFEATLIRGCPARRSPGEIAPDQPPEGDYLEDIQITIGEWNVTSDLPEELVNELGEEVMTDAASEGAIR